MTMTARKRVLPTRLAQTGFKCSRLGIRNSFCAHRWHRVHQVKFVPNAKESENAPDYRIVAGNFEIDAEWK